MTKTRRFALLAVAVMLLGTACANPSADDLTQTIEAGFVRFRLPDAARYREFEYPPEEISPPGFARWETPGWPTASVNINHSTWRDIQYCLDRDTRPWVPVERIEINIPGGDEAFYCHEAPTVIMLHVRHSDNLGAAMSFSFLEDSSGNSPLRDDFHEMVSWIMSTIEIDTDFGPLIQQLQAGPIRFSVPEGVTLEAVEPGSFYRLADRSIGVSRLVVKTADERLDLETCEVVDNIPGAQQTRMCQHYRRTLYPVLVVDTPDGSQWTIYGNTRFNETFVQAVFDTITVDEDWSQQ